MAIEMHNGYCIQPIQREDTLPICLDLQADPSEVTILHGLVCDRAGVTCQSVRPWRPLQ